MLPTIHPTPVPRGSPHRPQVKQDVRGWAGISQFGPMRYKELTNPEWTRQHFWGFYKKVSLDSSPQ